MEGSGRLTETFEACFEHNLGKGWAATGNHAMFHEVRERARTSTDARFGEGELRAVIEAKYPALAVRLAGLIAQGVVKELGMMVYLPKHCIGKTEAHMTKSVGEKKGNRRCRCRRAVYRHRRYASGYG